MANADSVLIPPPPHPCPTPPYPLQAMAAVLGGTQSLHTNSFDEAIALPTDFSAGLARSTQLILAEETGICDVADPLGGSYYVERLTAEMEARAGALIDEVEGMGGMTEAIVAGLPKLKIEECAARQQAHIDAGRQVIVGVNKYAKEGDQGEALDVRKIDNTAVLRAQKARLEVRLAGLGLVLEGGGGGRWNRFEGIKSGGLPALHPETCGVCAPAHHWSLPSNTPPSLRIPAGGAGVEGRSRRGGGAGGARGGGLHCGPGGAQPAGPGRQGGAGEGHGGRDLGRPGAALGQIRGGRCGRIVGRGGGHEEAFRRVADIHRRTEPLGPGLARPACFCSTLSPLPPARPGDMATGTYAASLGDEGREEAAACAAAVARFEAVAGRRPRILVAKMGMDGHDRGAKVMATG